MPLFSWVLAMRDQKTGTLSLHKDPCAGVSPSGTGEARAVFKLKSVATGMESKPKSERGAWGGGQGREPKRNKVQAT